MHIYADKEEILKICAESKYLHDIEKILDLKCFDLKNIINENSSNNYSSLREADFNGKVGIYVFLDSCQVPVYVGVSGVLEKNVQSNLFRRVTSQLTASSHLLKNIIEVEKVLNKNLKLEHNKRLILKYAPYLLVYPCETIEQAQALELILLSSWRLKYNR